MAEGTIEKRYIPIIEKITDTTSYSGAINLPYKMRNGFINAYGDTPYLIFRRDPSYLTVRNIDDLTPVTDTEVAINILYIP
jgi:hypothetical protein